MSDSSSEPPRITLSLPTSRPNPTISAELSGSAGFTADGLDDLRRVEAEKLKALRRGVGIDLSAEVINDLVDQRVQATGAVFRQLETIRKDLTDGFLGAVVPTLAPKLRGELINPDGTPAERVIVEALRPTFTASEGIDNADFSWAVKAAVTDARGLFSLDLPNLRLPQNGLRLRIRGQNTTLTEAVPRIDALDGELGLVVLDRTVLPLQRSILGELADILPVDPEDAEENISDFTGTQAPIVLGEGDCASEYRTEGGTVSRRRYSVLYRLIDPLVGPKNIVRTRPVGGNRFVTTIPGGTFAQANLSAETLLSAFNNDGGDWDFRDRIPIDEPIDIEDFFEDLEQRPQDVPKASSLALGYIAKMRSTAVHAGMSLGRLVYSLPLAPGEEQRIVVSEQRETLTVRERESLTFEEQQEFEEARDTSFNSTFETALDEVIRGTSSFSTKAFTKSFGGAGGIGGGLFGGIGAIVGGVGFSGARSSSNSSGSSSNTQNTSRDFLSDTHETFSAALERAASVKRNSARTSVRTATASDRRTATTKFVANRNHCHAMTMQWFEVLRDFSLETRIEGVQLVVFVPMQLIRFRRLGQGDQLPGNVNRSGLLSRYKVILRHADVFRRAFRNRRRFRTALKLLEEFYADKDATPQNAPGVAQDIVSFEAQGTFMPNDDISAVIFTQDGDRVGPVPLTGSPIDIDNLHDLPAETRENLLVRLADARRDPTNRRTYTGSVALPRSVERSDIARVELRRRTGSFAYSFYTGPDPINIFNIWEHISNLEDADDLDRATRNINRSLHTTISGSDFDDLVGAPMISEFEARMNEDAQTIVDDNTFQALPATLPYSVQEVPDVLSRRDLRRIEEMYQHIVADTVRYSRVIWASMTDEERAILLERFTIGVPDGGLDDASSEISLLSTVQNKVLGFYGNAMIMPFSIPPDLADRMEMRTGDIQDSLLAFHREDFRPPRRTISLPTRGLLGEAVLGRCNSCEMIDHRRFWNWQDSPTPPPVGDTPVLPADSDAIFGTRAPSDLPANQPSNTLTIAGGDIGTGQAVPSSQLAEILKAAPDLARAGTDLTGLKELQAQLALETQSVAAGRDKAIDTATDLTKELVGKATELAGKGQEIAAARKEEEAKKQAAEKKKTAADNAAKLKGFEDIAKNASGVSALIGGQPDGNRTGFVQNLFKDFPGGAAALANPSNTLLLAKLFGAFTKANTDADDGSATKAGSQSVLDFLNGLSAPAEDEDE
ncbi:hypothetical protein [Ruegeria atlantica]|uniref:ATPase involved in DNA repair n=1 Tax=Ruegeria atlantica TaxID=81569 RepID=A0ABX1WHW6_9RHOB|nr:hypothetical protein [Ruegeria atlantica]NOD32777.1 hypothetical protein [Ruegeria atlantica]